MEYEYNDGRRPGGRLPRLYLAKGGEVRKFIGETIPGFVAVATAEYTQSGKWSNTDYRLVLAPGVRPIYFLSPLHGTWGDDLASWGEVAEKLGLPIEVAQAVVREEYPSTAERLDKLEEFASAVEADGAATETVIVSFGSPTNRAISAGYWSLPKSGRTSDGRTVTVVPGQRASGEPDWSAPVVVEPAGANVISSRHKPGMHGGYWTVEVAAPLVPSEQPAD
jgi:hypothetical protein